MNLPTSVSEVVQTIKDYVNESQTRRDNVYQRPENLVSCKYTRGQSTDGECGCLFGQVARKHWSDTYAKMVEMDNRRENCIRDILESLDIQGTNEEYLWVVSVQYCQDRGNTWASCIQYADAYQNA
jgi:hypothetical protein